MVLSRKKVEHFDEIDKIISSNDKVYILSLRFTDNNTNGQVNRDVGQYLTSQGMKSLTGLTTGTAWIGSPKIDTLRIQKKLNEITNNLKYFIFLSSFQSGAEIGDIAIGKSKGIRKIGNDNIKPEESFYNDGAN